MKIGVVADTHVPDRINELDQSLVSQLKDDGVELIIHAGDICVNRTLEQLSEIAPVHAVRGNRDWLFVNKLSRILLLDINSKTLGVMHGHGGIFFYLWDKILTYTVGYDFERYYQKVKKTFKNADIIIFGHTHRPVCIWRDGTLVLNPGSASLKNVESKNRTYGLLQIDRNGKIYAEIKSLPDNFVKR